MISNIRLAYLLTAEYGSVDNSGKSSAIGIFNSIIIPKDKVKLVMPMFVVGRILFPERTVDTALDLVIRISGPDFVSEETVTGMSNKGSSSLNFVIRFQALEFSKKGIYAIQVLLNKEEIKEGGGFSFNVK